MMDKPYESRKLPNGHIIDYFRYEKDPESQQAKLDILFGNFEPYAYSWGLRGTEARGQCDKNANLDDFTNALWEKILEPGDFE